MSNVIHVHFPTPQTRQGAVTGALLRDFATARRRQNDVFWLKENGELLNILECTGTAVASAHLEVHEQTDGESAERLGFFPQYYRFLLSMALDLEDLGMPGDLGEQMCDWVVAQDLPGAETSDIQRLEANRLLARRARAPQDRSDDVERRLRQFISMPSRFALPNKKAAYELTHIVFYLSEYGRRDPKIGKMACKSLENVGIWAFLDGNADLLAEICIAMRYAKEVPPAVWEDWIAQEIRNLSVQRIPVLSATDGYHTAFMGAWLGGLRGTCGLEALVVPGGTGVLDFRVGAQKPGVLREMSRHLFDLGATRSSDWERMRGRIDALLSPAARAHLHRAEEASAGFADFFESFARTTRVMRA